VHHPTSRTPKRRVCGALLSREPGPTVTHPPRQAARERARPDGLSRRLREFRAHRSSSRPVGPAARGQAARRHQRTPPRRRPLVTIITVRPARSFRPCPRSRAHRAPPPTGTVAGGTAPTSRCPSPPSDTPEWDSSHLLGSEPRSAPTADTVPADPRSATIAPLRRWWQHPTRRRPHEVRWNSPRPTPDAGPRPRAEGGDHVTSLEPAARGRATGTATRRVTPGRARRAGQERAR
jgi:hypothetical protein